MRNPVSKAGLAACGALLLLVLCPSGCGRSVPSGMVRVRGEVTFEGKPLPTGTVMLEGDQELGSGAGRIQPNGTFEIVVRPGDYRVAVRSLEEGASLDENNNPIEPKSLIPERYQSLLTSGLQATVTPQADRLTISLAR